MLTKEETQWLKDFDEKIQTQDTVYTAKPVIYTIHQDVETYCEEPIDFDETTYRVVRIDDYEMTNIDEFKIEMEEFGVNIDILSHIKDIDDLYHQLYYLEIPENIKEQLTFYVMKIEHRQPDNTNHMFLTKDAAEKFIKNNEHNLNNPTIFVNHAYRNYELADLLDIVHNIFMGLND